MREKSYQNYEFEDFMADLHTNSMKLVNKVSLTESIDKMVILSPEDLFNLVAVTEDLYNKSDIIKIEMHL